VVTLWTLGPTGLIDRSSYDVDKTSRYNNLSWWAHQDSNLGPADYESDSRVFARHPGKKLGARRGRVESRAEAAGDRDRTRNGARVPVYEHGPWDVAATSLVTRLA